MKGYERRTERNQERILQATLELFQAHGMKKTTVNDIAQKAGVSPATVYNHFSSKNDLVHATVRFFLDSTSADFREILKGDLPFLEKMNRILIYKSDMLGGYQGELMQKLISEDVEIREMLDTVYLKDLMQMIIDFYEEGKKQGYVNPELSTENIIRYMMIIRSGMAAESVLTEDPEQNRRVLEDLTPLLLYGIMGRPGRPDPQKPEG